MNESSVKKCRACLKSSTKAFPLNKQATVCNPKKTYGQLLKEHAKLECTADYERLMPQYLCVSCCKRLRNTYAFINQAQYCNNKLINVISKQLNCLQERTIDMPNNANNLNNSFEVQTQKDFDCQKSLNTKADKCCFKGMSPQLEVSNDNKTPEHRRFKEINISDYDQNNLNDYPIECTLTSDNKAGDNLKIYTEDLLESETDTICPICGKNMSRSDNLINHIRTQHDIEDPSKLLHKSESEPKEAYVCKLCSSKYSNKYTYLYHIKHKHSVDEAKAREKMKDKNIKCRLCEYTARTYAALNYHTRSKHGTEKDKFKCKFCSYLCLKKFDLLMHVKNSHKEMIKTLIAKAENKKDRRLTSTQENNSLESEDSLSDDVPLIQRINKLHKLTKIEEEKEQFSDEDFIRNILNIKKRQTKSSTKSLARRCDECGNIYKNYKALYAHQRHVHISEDKYSLCPHCGKKYKRRTDLRIHIEKAHIPKNSNEIAKQPAKVREKRFMCTECSYVCTTITILNIHINRHHTGEKPYKCDICFKSFIVPYDLKIHRYLHTGERPYKCPICSKGFRDNSHMIKHKRIHSSERPYKCKDCSKSFTQSYNLSVHKRKHLKEKKLNCVICGQVFENRSLLNIHRIKENHHDEVV